MIAIDNTEARIKTFIKILNSGKRLKILQSFFVFFLFVTCLYSNNEIEMTTIDNSKTEVTSFTEVRYGTEEVDGLDVFYREAGSPSNKAIVLLHGFPSSSHMYREVLAGLGDEFYLIAPDYPGFGDSSFPSVEEYDYTFDNISNTIEKFLAQKGIESYVLMVHDYGAPIGFRIAVRNPEKVIGLIAMNGNAYEEGLGPGWETLRGYWQNKSTEIEQKIIPNAFSYEGLKWQYTNGTKKPESILPDNWNLDYLKFSREGQHRMHLDLFYDYQNNIKAYPKWQTFLKKNQPPTLVVWGKHDVYFPEAGAEALKKDLKDIEYHILDTGHFPLEEKAGFIVDKMRAFLRRII